MIDIRLTNIIAGESLLHYYLQCYYIIASSLFTFMVHIIEIHNLVTLPT